MPAIAYNFTVVMDDDETWHVAADQRDLARYEAQDFYDLAKRHTWYRFMAWSASQRQALTKMPWAKFNTHCVEVIDGDDGEEKNLDPTQPDPSGESS